MPSCLEKMFSVRLLDTVRLVLYYAGIIATVYPIKITKLFLA